MCIRDSYYTGANNGTYYKRCTRCSEKTDVRNNPYTITYHANGGKGTMAVQNCTYTAKLNLLSNTFQRDYYTFKNWTTEPDGGGRIYSDTQPVSNLTAVYLSLIHIWFDSWCNQEGVGSTLAAAKIVNNFNPQN